jgi:DNA-binding LacI/PurR family transcriptional regulator
VNGKRNTVSSSERHRPTMGDVAEQVGVSRQLVSMVFRDAAGPSARTRKKVFKAAEELGYHPDTAARMLRRNRSTHVGVLFTATQPFEQDLIKQMYPAAAELGLVLVLGALVTTRDERLIVEEMLGYRTGALVLVGSKLSDEALRRVTRQVPVVEVGRGSAAAGTDLVHTPGDVGVELAVEHLVGLGHQRIAFVEGGDMPGAVLRRDGYLRGMERHGLSGEVDTLPGDYSEEGGSRAATRLLSRSELPTAVVASNDQAAVGVVCTLLRAGIAVPREVSVTGYDDSWISRLSYLDLTTVHQDTPEMARAALRAAADRMAGATGPRRELALVPELVVRSSTCPPRQLQRTRLARASATR